MAQAGLNDEKKTGNRKSHWTVPVNIFHLDHIPEKVQGLHILVKRHKYNITLWSLTIFQKRIRDSMSSFKGTPLTITSLTKPKLLKKEFYLNSDRFKGATFN